MTVIDTRQWVDAYLIVNEEGVPYGEVCNAIYRSIVAYPNLVPLLLFDKRRADHILRIIHHNEHDPLAKGAYIKELVMPRKEAKRHGWIPV